MTDIYRTKYIEKVGDSDDINNAKRKDAIAKLGLYLAQHLERFQHKTFTVRMNHTQKHKYDRDNFTETEHTFEIKLPGAVVDPVVKESSFEPVITPDSFSVGDLLKSIVKRPFSG